MAYRREVPFDFKIGNYNFMMVGDSYASEPVPEIAGRTVQLAEELREWRSWHLGFGYSHFLIPNTYHYALNMDMRFARQAIMGPLVNSITLNGSSRGNVTDFFEQTGLLYVLDGRYCERLNSDDTVQAIVGAATGVDFGSGNAAIKALPWGGNTVVTMGESDDAYSFTGSAWNQLTTSAAKGSYLTSYYKDTNFVLVRSYNNSGSPSISEITRGDSLNVAANWAAAIPVADSDTTYRPITGMTAFDRTVFITKTDGLYYNDQSGRTPRRIPFYTLNSENGKNIGVDSAGLVWVPAVEGYYRYDNVGGTVLDVSPGRGLPNASPIYGRVTARAQYRGWHYAAMYNGTDTYIMCGREREADEPGIGPIIWHGALVKVSGATVGAMHISTLYPTTAPKPRLYYGVGTNVAYIKLPSNGDNPLLDSGYSYCASGSLYLPADEWGISGTRWALMGFELENEGLTGTTYADLYAQLDHGGWQKINEGTVKSQGKASVNIPSSGDWRFSRCALRLDVTNGSSTSTPKIRAIVGKAARRVAVRDLISVRLWCSDYVRDHDGKQMRVSGKDQLQALKDLQENMPTSLIDYLTGSKRERRVMMFPVRERLAEYKYEDKKTVTLTADVTMAVLDETQTPAYYGTDTYGAAYYS